MKRRNQSADDFSSVSNPVVEKKQSSILKWVETGSSPTKIRVCSDDGAIDDCPICAFDLKELSAQKRQEHVNRCLDGLEDGDPGNSSVQSPNVENQENQPSAASTVINAWKSIFATSKIRVGKALGYGFDEPADTAPSSSTVVKQNGSSVCPFYKKIPGTTFSVDAFSYGQIPGITCYFLSHFHSDHYMGLSKSFKHGIIYCSSITANLVVKELRVDPSRIVRLPMNEPIVVDNTIVTLIDANHCPGSVLFHFYIKRPKVPLAFQQVPQPMSILHTGDFRAHNSHLDHAVFKDSINLPVDILYLDTTYCKPSYCFPPQEKVIEAAIAICRRNLSCENMDNPINNNLDSVKNKSSVLFVVGTYLIGKERVFLGIANALDCLIFTNDRKRKILECQESFELQARLTDNPHATCLHVVGMGDLSIPKLSVYLSCYPEVSKIIAFRPTGWSFSKNVDITNLQPQQRSDDGKISIYGIPYSEHSSFDELKMFVTRLKPKHIIPTVNNGTERSRSEMQKHFDTWLKK